MSSTLRLKISGLDDRIRVEALKRSLGLVADVQGVVVDPERGEVLVKGDPDEHRIMVHLANEGFEAHPVHESIQHANVGRTASGPPTRNKGNARRDSRTGGAAPGQTGQASTQVGGKIEQVMAQVHDNYGAPAGVSRGGALIPGAELNSPVSARPVRALMIAMGVGYVLARLIHR